MALSGRLGHGHVINGDYHVVHGHHHGGEIVLRHADVIPCGYKHTSGRHLYLYYCEENNAWAVSTVIGSLEALAYAVGRHVVQPPRSLRDADAAGASCEAGSAAENHDVFPYADPVWFVSTEEGDYEADPNVVMEGPYVPSLARLANSMHDDASAAFEDGEESGMVFHFA